MKAMVSAIVSHLKLVRLEAIERDDGPVLMAISTFQSSRMTRMKGAGRQRASSRAPTVCADRTLITGHD